MTLLRFPRESVASRGPRGLGAQSSVFCRSPPGLNRERSQAGPRRSPEGREPALARVTDGLPRPLLAKVRHRPSRLRGCEPRRSSPRFLPRSRSAHTLLSAALRPPDLRFAV